MFHGTLELFPATTRLIDPFRLISASAVVDSAHLYTIRGQNTKSVFAASGILHHAGEGRKVMAWIRLQLLKCCVAELRGLTCQASLSSLLVFGVLMVLLPALACFTAILTGRRVLHVQNGERRG